MSIYTNAREVGDKIDLLKTNESFFKKIKVFYDDYGKMKNIASSVKSSILIISETTDLSNISSDEKEKLKTNIEELKEKIETLKNSKDPNDALELYKANKDLLELEATLELYEGKSYDEVTHFIDMRFLEYNFTLEDALKLTVKRKAEYIEYLLDKYKYTPEEIYLCLEDLLMIKENPIFNEVDSSFKEQIYNCIYNELGLIYYPNEINSQTEDKVKVSEKPPKHPHPVLRELYYIGKTSVKEKKKETTEEEEKKKGEEEKDKEKKDEQNESKDPNENTVEEVTQNVNAKWRTIASIAVGIGLGAGVWFAFGAVGVTALAIGGGIAKRLVAKKQAQLQELKQNGQLKIHRAEDFPKSLKGQLQRFRSYINSPEGLDAVQKILTSSILSSVAFNIFGPMLGLEGGKVISALQGAAISGETVQNGSEISNTTPEVNTAEATTTSSDLKVGDLRVGDSAGNLTTGYTNSISAGSGSNGVSLNQSLINNDSSHIGSFLVRKGGETFTITDPSLSVSDIVNQYGVAETDVIANVVQNGTQIPQSWNPLSDIVDAKNAINAVAKGGRGI